MTYRSIFLIIVGWISQNILAGTGFLTHLNVQDSQISNSIVVTNASLNAATIRFTLADGSDFFQEVPGSASLVIQPSAFPTASPFASFETSSPLVQVQVHYQLGEHSWMALPESAAYRAHQFFPDSNGAWLGFALVNLGDQTTAITLHGQMQKGHGESFELVDGLAPGQKAVQGFSLLTWGEMPTALTVAADQPILCMVLQQNAKGLTVLPAQSQWNQEIHCLISGGFYALNEELVVRNGSLTFKGKTVALPESVPELDAIWVQPWSERQIQRKGQTCCDFWEYQFTVLDGGQYNAFFFNGDDINKDERIQPILQAMAELYRLAERLTGEESIPF